LYFISFFKFNDSKSILGISTLFIFKDSFKPLLIPSVGQELEKVLLGVLFSKYNKNAVESPLSS